MYLPTLIVFMSAAAIGVCLAGFLYRRVYRLLPTALRWPLLLIPALAAVFAASIVGAAAGDVVGGALVLTALVLCPTVAFLVSAIGRRAYFAAAFLTATPLLAAGGIQLAYELDVSTIDLARSSEDETEGQLLWLAAITYSVPLGLGGLAIGVVATWWAGHRHLPGIS